MDARRWEVIQQIFANLVELDETARARQLAVLGDMDPELRAAVRSLLGADAEAGARLAPFEAGILSVPGIASDPLDLAGRTISHFRVLEPLGIGGMGVVYRAEDTRLGRPVALKFLLPPYSLDAAAKARFLREGHSAAALDHPNLCTIHEVGETEDGRLFLAMALYGGETLKTRLARAGPLPVSEALDIARQIARGLACAHAAGIVHRDLKPGNVMLLPDRMVKILDFGLAKARDQSVSETGARFGTASYMAPEQIRGQPVDSRADLWALGVVLYEMLTGRKPFGGEDEVSIAHAILHDEPLRPRRLRRELSLPVEKLVLRLLQKDPAARLSPADKCVDRLEQVGTLGGRAGASGSTRLLAASRLLAAFRGRGPTVGASAAVGLVGVLLAAALLGRRQSPIAAEAPSRVVVVPFENRTTVADLDPLGTMIAEWVTQGLSEAPFLTVLDTRSVTGLHALDAPGVPGMRPGTVAGAVVTGSYFLQSDSLHFQAQIVSTTDGSVLVGIDDVTAPRDRPLTAAEGLRQRVLAAFASLHDKDVSTFQTALTQPPTYAAYREYVEGLAVYMGPGEYRDAARRFQRAAVLDSTFLTARVWAAQAGVLAAGLRGDTVWAIRADSMIIELNLRRHRLAPFDRARLDFVVALRDWEWLNAYSAALRLIDASPGSVDAQREAALSALRVLRPREALSRLQELDPAGRLMREWAGYWAAVAWAQHLLKQYENELTAARRGRQLHRQSPSLLYVELRALAALGRVAELDSLGRAELPVFPGQAGLIAFGVAGELMAHGHAESAHRFARYAADLAGPHPLTEQAAREWLERHIALRREIGDPYCYLGEHVQTRSALERANEEWLHWRAELALLVGDIETAADRAAQLQESRSHGLLLARILAAQGESAAARAALQEWETHALQSRGTLRGLEIDRASVLVRLGDQERALETLAEALGRAAINNTSWGQDGHAHPDLAPLWGDSRFQALIRPRG